jgi:Domain of unknown function (DUF4342)
MTPGRFGHATAVLFQSLKRGEQRQELQSPQWGKYTLENLPCQMEMYQSTREERTQLMTQYDPNLNQGPEGREYREEIHVQGQDLADKVKEIIHEGNARRIIIRQGEHVVLELPLTVGVIGTLLAPWLAAVGAVGALIANCTIEVVRSDQP